MVALSKELEAYPKSTYCHNEYQCYMASCIVVAGSGKFTAGVVTAGQGKTFVMILVAHYYLKHLSMSMVSICSSSDLVTQQLEADSRALQPS